MNTPSSLWDVIYQVCIHAFNSQHKKESYVATSNAWPNDDSDREKRNWEFAATIVEERSLGTIWVLGLGTYVAAISSRTWRAEASGSGSGK